MSTFTYDITDNTGKLRLNIADIDLTTTAGARSTWTCLFTDEELGVFLDRASSDLNLASYYALMSVASNRAMLARKKVLGDYQEDLSKVADEVRKQALEYLNASKLDEGDPAVDWAEQAVSDFAYREILMNEDLRNG